MIKSLNFNFGDKKAVKLVKNVKNSDIVSLSISFSEKISQIASILVENSVFRSIYSIKFAVAGKVL